MLIPNSNSNDPLIDKYYGPTSNLLSVSNKLKLIYNLTNEPYNSNAPNMICIIIPVPHLSNKNYSPNTNKFHSKYQKQINAKSVPNED